MIEFSVDEEEKHCTEQKERKARTQTKKKRRKYEQKRKARKRRKEKNLKEYHSSSTINESILCDLSCIPLECNRLGAGG